MTILEDTKLGRIVSTDGGPSFSSVDLRLDSGKLVKPGQLVYAFVDEAGESKIVVLRISNAVEYNEYENPLSSQVRDAFKMESSRGRTDLLRKFLIAKAQSIEVLRKVDGKFVSEEPSLIVPAGSEVYTAFPGLSGQVLGFVDPATPGALVIGKALGSENITVALSADAVLPRHILIAGSTGTGKSYLIGVITEQLKNMGLRHVNIDVHGELTKATSELGGQNLIPGRTLKVKLSSLEEPEVLNMLPINNELHVDIVSRAFLNLKGRGVDFGVAELKREALNVAQSYGVKQNTLDIIDARVETLNRISILGPGFSWTQALQQEGMLVNVDCRDIGHSELRIVVAAIARELMNLRRKGLIPPVVFSMDEAHLFLPAGDTTPSSQVLAEIIRFGRHHGVGIIISSQSPSDIDKRIAKITNTRFFFALEPSELASVSGLLADSPPELVQNLPRLRVGTALLAGSRESVKHALVVQIAQRKTTHGGETPRMLG
jgi:DNA helicase HerA-like ATPase